MRARDAIAPVNRARVETLYIGMSACPEYLPLDRPAVGPENRRTRALRGVARTGRRGSWPPVEMIHSDRRQTLDAKQALDRFLAGVERRAHERFQKLPPEEREAGPGR